MNWDRPHRDPCHACLACDVRRQAICAALDDQDVGALEAIMTATALDANATLVHEGDPRRRVYSLTGGMLRLSTLLPDGRRQITGFLMPGDYLGLADDDTYALSAEAVVPSQLCSFPVAQMDGLMARFPRLKDRLHLMTRTALRQARDNQIVLGRLAPVEKVASFLLVTAQRAAAAGQAGDVVNLPMTRADIADYLGLTVETVSRSFTKLKVQDLIHLPDPHHVTLVDRHALQAVAGWSA
ncbi:helix-turn-helix domain-containing protein [Lichenihabitans sp. Uapishka_5]|uniref:Crp/Fnr family transcriptional regulator n=1 Tax=Lichenihabitans sp. Uapishka_5 TaxID=3037302 RepID=UPI0029E81512|nr:helix-turn-helix domain-containing protein [Lichenihabitans sp. Uapishka_5]MDX7952352.1 helix-turn-helix domain-containing protein [Lichenihabitans sp. Uapishka_5]